VRQYGAIHSLRADHVDVVELRKLLRRERLSGPEHHVPGVVHDHVEAAVRRDDRRNAGVDG
jgi:hypothetical protein